MTGWALDVRSPGPLRDTVAAWLVGRTGHSVVESEDGGLIAFAGDRGDADQLGRDLVAAFGDDIQSSGRALEPADWRLRWREGLGIRRIGRVTIVPSWLRPPPDTEALVVLDPETAFGSGEHGSTRAALRLLDARLRAGTTVLDLGSGSGILAIAAVKLGAARAIGIDVDPEAVMVAEGNADRNGVRGRVAFVQGDAAALAPLLGPVELVVSNILREANLALLDPIRSALLPGGCAVFAGMEATERESFLPALIGRFVPSAEATDEGWWAVSGLRTEDSGLRARTSEQTK